jgi:hypothetical protein
MAKKRDIAPQPGVKIPLDIKIGKSTAYIAINLANITATKAVIAINLANLIPVPHDKAEPPDFAGDSSEFDDFIDRNFPRSKYAALRKALDKPSPVSWGHFPRKSYSAAFPFAMLFQDEWRATRISFYREIARLGKLLRATTAGNSSCRGARTNGHARTLAPTEYAKRTGGRPHGSNKIFTK